MRTGYEPTQVLWTTKVLRDSGMHIYDVCGLVYMVYTWLPCNICLRHVDLDVHSMRNLTGSIVFFYFRRTATKASARAEGS